MIALDSETTGLDLYHGCRPFFISVYDDSLTEPLLWWEWDVDPETRRVSPPADELAEVERLVLGESNFDTEERDASTSLILQNAKFDVTALDTLLPGIAERWPWDRTHDILFLSHLVASNRPKNLTDRASQHLGIDIEPYEKRLKDACLKARNIARRQRPKWRIAKDGEPDMPSCSEKAWKSDTWLPRQLADDLGYPADHPWRTVLQEYALVDADVTYHLFKALHKIVSDRGLLEFYNERRKIGPIVQAMERRGVTVSGERLTALQKQFMAEALSQGRKCVELAASVGYKLDMPRGGANQSLRTFMLDVLKLEPVANPKAKTDEPSLNKEVMRKYVETLEPGLPLDFIKTLLDKRARDTSLSYMRSYRKFWVQWNPHPPVGCTKDTDGTSDWWVLHPNLNSTGTDTLRFSSSNPNEQNISKREGFNLRQGFGPAPGREWFSLDASGIEDRLPAFESKQDELIRILQEPDAPPYYGSNHFLRFETVYPDLWAEAVKEVGLNNAGPFVKKKYASTWYQYVKNGGFAIQYGAQDREDGLGTADRAFHKPGAHALLKQRFSKLEKLNQQQINHANRHGYVETIPDKTVNPARGYPLQCTRTAWGKIKPTVPLSYHIQGSAMWWTMKAMIRCEEILEQWRREGYYGFITLQVHDELVFDLPRRADPRTQPKKSNLDRVRVLKEAMVRGGDDYDIPTPVKVEYHPVHWGEGFSLNC